MKKWKKGLKRITAIAMAVLMVGTTIDLSALAATQSEVSTGSLCEHHTEHTAECGYVEAVEGSACTHEHNAECGYDTVSENGVCTHQHDDTCGYVEAVEGHACGYACEECSQSNDAVCTCAEKCTEDNVNIWCDVCGVQGADACEGNDTATTYANDINATLHAYNGLDGGLGYDGAVYLQWWDGSATVTNATAEEFTGWNPAITRYKLTDEGNNWYTLTIQGSVDGFQFLNSDGSKATGGIYDSNIVAPLSA